MSTRCLRTRSSVACCDRMSTLNLSLLSTHSLSNEILKTNFINHQRRQRSLQTSALLLTEKILVNNKQMENNFRISKMSLIICSLNHLSTERTLTKGKEGLVCSAGFQPAAKLEITFRAKEARTGCPKKREGYQFFSERWHTESKLRLAAFLRFHPRINWLKEIVWNRCCVMRHGSSCISCTTALPWWRAVRTLNTRSSGCNVQERKIVPCQTDLTLKLRGQLWSVLLGINLCRARIKRWMGHVCRRWFIWTWHLNP